MTSNNTSFRRAALAAAHTSVSARSGPADGNPGPALTRRPLRALPAPCRAGAEVRANPARGARGACAPPGARGGTRPRRCKMSAQGDCEFLVKRARELVPGDLWAAKAWLITARSLYPADFNIQVSAAAVPHARSRGPAPLPRAGSVLPCLIDRQLGRWGWGGAGPLLPR